MGSYPTFSGASESINIVTDSQYVWLTVNYIETVTLSNNNDLDQLFCQLQTHICNRDFPFCNSDSFSFPLPDEMLRCNNEVGQLSVSVNQHHTQAAEAGAGSGGGQVGKQPDPSRFP